MARLIDHVLVGSLLLCALGMSATAETMRYHLEHPGPNTRFSRHQIEILAKLNRADPASLRELRQIVVPNRWEEDELLYSPMPMALDAFAGEDKALLVDLTAQAFGAYESGKLVRWGPVSSGDREHPTPPGVYHLNWHAPVRISSENSSWVMHWYFNFSSQSGFALHEYTLPGRPASHGCVRLLAADAKWLYGWGAGWQRDPDTEEVIRPGTLVVLIGKYRFSAPRPWLNQK